MQSFSRLAALVFTGCLLLSTARSAEAAGLPPGVEIESGAVDDKTAEIVALESGAVFNLPGGTRMTLSAGARIAFYSRLSLKLSPPPAPPTPTQSLRLKTGRVEVVVPKSGGTAVLVIGTLGASGVTKPGRSTVTVDGRTTAFAAHDGEMLVGVNSKLTPLGPGTARSYSAAHPRGATHKKPDVPKPRTTSALLVTVDGSPMPLAFDWPEVPGAVEYEATVRRGKDPPSVHRTSAPRVKIRVTEAGRYRFVVRAVDRLGLRSDASRVTTSRVLSAKLPPDAYVAATGAIRMRPGQRVALSGIEGLEVTYGSSTYFVPAPKNVGLRGSKAVVIRLRDKASKREAMFRLEPESISVNVAVGPKRAKWPRDQVTVTIELRDGRGNLVPKSLELVARVKVGISPARVTWQHRNGKLEGKVSRPHGDGPWMVRAEVTDKKGRRLAYDSLQVARGKKARAPAFTRMREARRR